MGWASEWFRKTLARCGIYLNEPEENRCGRCKKRDWCLAYETGVIYPCPYFEEDLDHGAEKYN